MIIFELEDALVEFFTQHSRDYLFRSNEETSEMVPPAVWSGFIPRNEVGQVVAGDITIFPCVIVQASKGVQAAEDYDSVEADVLIGVFDDTKDQQGYRDVVNLIQRFKDRVNEESIIRDRFPRRLPIKWQVNRFVGGAGTNYFPYFFGEMSFMFDLPVMASQYDVSYADGETTPGRSHYPVSPPEINPQLVAKINRFINGED